jgi:hypothetical protein
MKRIDLAAVFDQWPAKVLALGAAVLLFLFNRFDSLDSKVLSLPVRLVADTTLLPSQDWNNRVRVTLRGSSEVLAGLDETALEVLADFSSHSGEGLWKAPLQVVRHGAALQAEGFSPAEVKEVAEDVRQKLLRVPDVNKVELFGAQDEKLYIEMSQRRLSQPRRSRKKRRKPRS